MKNSVFSLNLFDGTGKVLLLGSIGYTLFRVVQGKVEFEDAILGAVVGALGLFFYQDGFKTLNLVSEAIIKFLSDHMDRRSLQDQLIAAIEKSSSTQLGNTPSAGEMLGQMWRAGVWGVVSTLVELAFLISDYLILVSSKVFLAQVLLFFPLACGVYPVFPKVLFNLVLYAIELSLWRAMLIVVHEVTAIVSHDYLANDSTQGLQIIAVELIAIYLVISIPKTTHNILAGALSGDHGAASGFTSSANKILIVTKGFLGGKS